MSLSYLVEEHHEDLVVEDMRILTDDDDYDDDDDDNDNNEEEEDEMGVEASEEPFDVIQATSSNEGSSIDVRETKYRNRNNSKTNNKNKPYTLSAKPLTTTATTTSAANPVTPSPQKGNMRGTPTNEIGELPALSISKSDDGTDSLYRSRSNNNNMYRVSSNASGVTGARGEPSMRPLSPPSRAGLDDPEMYNHKMNRSSGSTASDDYMYGSEEEFVQSSRGSTLGSSQNGGGNSSHFASMDEMPMDERREFAKEQASRHLDALALCTGGDDPASTFCDHTLTSMNEWCAGGPPSRNAAAVAAAKRHLALNEKHSIRNAGGVEEQTAIEVEYVEPMYRGKNGEDDMYSPKKKNALLRAMARRAKDDYQTKNGKKGGKQNSEEVRDSSPTTTDNTQDGGGGVQVGESSPAKENVYASFSPSEKRKFLKLINGGMTPFDATSQVMKERMEAEELKSAASSNDGSRGATATIAAGAAVATGAVVAASSFKKQKKDKEPTTPKRRGLAFWKRGKDKDADKEANAQSSVKNQSSNSRALASVATSAKSPVTPPQVSRRSYQDSEDDDEIVEGFARSGINYYDAVRKDRSNEDAYDDDDEEEEASRKSRSKSKGTSVKFPKIGFSKLDKNGSKEENGVPGTPPQQISRGAVQVEPHVAIPSPVMTATSEANDEWEEQEEFIALSPLPAKPEQNTDTDGMVRPIPVKADGASQDRGIPTSMSGDSLLTEEDNGMREEKKGEEMYDTQEHADAMEEAMAAHLLGVPRSRSLEEQLQQHKLTERRSKEQVELDMDTYLNSTETMSHLGIGNASSYDHTSVVSGKSYRTSHTAGTNFTQSTRTRRPGQGKVRLEQEKRKHQQQQKKASGWQESIQAAAASTGRVWDPEYGWKDYIDPKTVVTEDDLGVQSSEMMHLPADRFKKRAEDEDSLLDGSSEPGSPPKVPFPQDWDEERSGMLREDDAGMERSLAPSRASSTPNRRRNKNPKVLTPPRDDKPRGWKETMMAAAASVKIPDGKQWDPERGWVGPDGREIHMTADLERERAYLEQVAVVADSDVQDFGTLNSVPAVPPNREPSVEQLDAIADMNQDSGHQFLSEDEDQVTDEDLGSIARSMDAKSVGRYMQIKETGSVSSHYRNAAAKKEQQLRSPGPEVIPEEGAEDTVPHPLTGASPATKEMFARMDQARGGGGAMNVQRQGLDKNDAGLFGEQQGAKSQRNSGPVDLDDVYDEETNVMQEVLALQEVEPPEDDINEQATNDSFGEAQDFSWDDEDEEEHRLSSHKPVPRLKINIRDPLLPDFGPASGRSGAAASEVSFGSLSTSSRSIPKLRGPKRDSSPIHSGRRPGSQTTHSTHTRREPDMIISTLSPQPVHDSSPSSDEEEILPMTTEQTMPDPPTTQRMVTPEKEDVEEVSPRELPFQLDPPEKSIDKNRSAPSQPIARKPSEDSEPASVRSLHDYWESRSTTPPTAQSAEWKSFLAKKVQAETAAAATKKSNVQKEKDTIFDFHGSEGYFPSSAKKNGRELGRRPGEPQDGAFDDISDLSPIRHDESDSDFAPSEASTQIVQGTTFLQRLQACAAPIVTKGNQCGPGVPMAAHLAFLRSNPSMSASASPEKHATNKAAPPAALCGRPDVIVEEDDEENSQDPEESPRSFPAKAVKSRSRSNPRPTRQKDDVSSVISDEFGAKTAYFEALAMKAAVSGGSKKKKRSPGSDVSGSTHSKTSGASSKHSDKFQQFLDRRASKNDASSQPGRLPQSMPMTKPPSGRQEVSSRAERYASEKVEEMMETMSSPHKSNVPGQLLDYRGRPMDQEETGAFPTLPRPNNANNHNPSLIHASPSRAAAEDLAAARVEAMMANLSTHALEDDEGEI